MRQDTSQVRQQSITGSLKRFCNLSLGGWDAWADTTIRFSIGDSIVAWANVARRQAQEAVQSLTTGLGQPTTVIVSPSIAQSGQPGAPATRSVLTESTIILGLTDCLVERTEVEVQAWLLPRVFNAVCVETDATPADTTASGQTVRTANRRLSLPLIFNETCQVLQSSARLGLQNSARTVRAAIMQDFTISLLPCWQKQRRTPAFRGASWSWQSWHINSYHRRHAIRNHGAGARRASSGHPQRCI